MKTRLNNAVICTDVGNRIYLVLEKNMTIFGDNILKTIYVTSLLAYYIWT